MRKLIPLLTAVALLTGGLATLPRPAAAQPMANLRMTALATDGAPLPATPVHWDRGYGYGGGYGGGYYAPPPPPPPPWYGRPHYRGAYGGGYYAPPPRYYGGGGGWYR